MATAARHGEASSGLTFRPDIEGLRAIAIVFVVLYHAGWRRISGGFLGVDVFFVLSGYLITGLLLREIRRTGTLSLMHFWARRARRLLPAAAVVTGVVLICNAVFLSPFEQIPRADAASAFAVYGSNMYFAVQSTEYFGQLAATAPLLHTWSLSVEEQFYLFFAPTLLVLAQWTMKRGVRAFEQRFLIWTAAISIVSFAGCLLLVQRYPSVAFYILPTRAWEFGLGAATVLLVERVTPTGGLAVEGLSLAGLAAVVGSGVLVRDAHPLGWTTVVPALGTTMLIYAGAAARPSIVARLLSAAPMRLLGRLSYSWYLWHWPMLVYLREVHPAPSLRLSLAVAMLSLVPAAVTYVFVESPIRFSRGLQKWNGPVVACALGLALVTVGAAQIAKRHANTVLAAPRFAPMVAAQIRGRNYDMGCVVEPLETVSPACTFGPGRNDTTVVLFGDSHAAQWFDALDSVSARRGWTFVTLTKAACPPGSISNINATLARRYVECEAWREKAFARIAALKPTMVLMSAGRTYNVLVNGQPMRSDTTQAGVDEWGAGLKRTLARLGPTKARLVVIQDTPHLAVDPPRCLVKFPGRPSLCADARVRAVDSVVSGVELSVVAATPNASYLNLTDAICDQRSCPVFADGIVRYRDTNHLSTQFSAALSTVLSTKLTEVLDLHRAAEPCK